MMMPFYTNTKWYVMLIIIFHIIAIDTKEAIVMRLNIFDKAWAFTNSSGYNDNSINCLKFKILYETISLHKVLLLFRSIENSL